MSDTQLDKISQITVPNEKGEEVTYELENTTYSPGINFHSDGNLEFSLTNDLGETETATLQNIAVGPHGHLYVDIEPSKGLEFRVNEDGTATVIGIGSFSGTELVIPSKHQGCLVVEIGSEAFRGTTITSVIIPDSIINIGASAFSGCIFLNNIQLGAGVIDIGASSFTDCQSIKSIKINEGITIIPNSAFSGCYNLTSVVIPNSVTSIDSYAFSGCYNLTSVVIPNSVTSIDSYAFSWCEALTSVVIPDSVTSIGYGAFEYCMSLTLYCEAASEPSGWHEGWNPSTCPVIWGFAGDFIAANKKINKLVVGEWIEATTRGNNSYQISLVDNGVYEYFCYLFNDSGPGCYYSNTIFYDNNVFGNNACALVDELVGEAGVFGTILLVMNSNDCYIGLTCKNHTELGYPERVVFKARKIRDI